MKVDYIRTRKDVKGFTLAEVLITIGIIGVVSALTIPSLLSHYRKSVVETRLLKFYSTINQAVKLAEIDYEYRDGWDKLGNSFSVDDDGNISEVESLEWVNKYIRPYLKFDTEVKNLNGKTELYFPDGSLLILSSASWLYFIDRKDYKLKENGSVDQSGAGKTMFIFLWQPEKGQGVEPYTHAWDGERDTLFTDENFGCMVEPVVHAHAYCTKLLQLSGWKIPKDYPIKF